MRRLRRIAHGALATGLAVLLAGCAAGLDNVPLPAPGATGPSYRLTAVFSNALNLPTKAKVKLFGADIGEVDEIRARNFTAEVTMRIRSDVPLYDGATAELRSATLLGDVFVQIRPDADQPADAARLHDGDVIGRDFTAAAPTVEELLNSMAMLVNGGTIGYLVKTTNGAGKALGGRGEKVQTLLEQTRTLLSRLTARSEQLDTALRNTSQMAAAMAARRDTLADSLANAAPAMAVIADNTTQITDLANRVGHISDQLARFPSIAGTDTRSLTADLNTLSAVVNDIALDPELSLYAFNRLLGILIKTTNSTAGHARTVVSKLTLAPWPDLNYPGDPGFHWTDGTDWHQMIGSLRYEWNVLLNNIYGAGR
ncbi:MCE family protein [Mycobacterium koreense]|uniref:Mammalian cell entry protein n=1 Tax=Mycolicibacillus koreensis TaxID=1069220 RepID=A0A7I7SEW0_9MYCO|nr:MCE family protein [Mycolicibacillus koreensis]MCV7248335.1 MCE family protein [Mycolicibacillus koreensis]ODR09536.1 mammalian cell entry protein [Mycolicibacillus koreensis]OSC33739.1 mammalian cell entry protein [Mycolicibacillus koreensis]BBY55273.1 putative Mce family protein [Mycolicibacillus koreensis]